MTPFMNGVLKGMTWAWLLVSPFCAIVLTVWWYQTRDEAAAIGVGILLVGNALAYLIHSRMQSWPCR